MTFPRIEGIIIYFNLSANAINPRNRDVASLLRVTIFHEKIQVYFAGIQNDQH
jgi:hypothetical protein